jgi:diaminopropionate ammonia-lyase
MWRCAPPPSAPKDFHRSMPGYRRTPLVDLPGLAEELAVGRVLVKDESSRLGLPSFKILGASWAVCRAVGARDSSSTLPQTLQELRSLRSRLGRLTLVTATDGNHGRAVARMARLIECDAHVFVPDVAGRAAAATIEQEGAEVTVIADSYDETVTRAARSAGDPHAVLVQDTSWPGYERIPQWIVDGYSTLFREIHAEVDAIGIPHVDVITVPTGVGSLAQAAVTAARSSPAERAPSALLAVEPDSAACLTASLQEGRPITVPTGRTSMAGLNCGTPSTIAWPFLVHGLDAAITVSDDQVGLAARDLGLGGVSSGPCGAASLAALRAALLDVGGDRRRKQLGLTPSSTVVLLNTEGASRPTVDD